MKEYVYYSFNSFRFTLELYENNELVRRMIVGLDELDRRIEDLENLGFVRRIPEKRKISDVREPAQKTG